MKRLAGKFFRRWGLEVRRVRRPEERFLLPLNRGSAARFIYFRRMLERVAGLGGDIVECGVGKAKSFQMLALLLYESGERRKLWGFDSFEGYPEPSSEDSSPRNLAQGQWKVIGREDVNRILALAGLPEEFRRDRVVVVKGFFENTLRTAGIGPIALLHLDVNLYRSYLTCLSELFPRVVPGGIVMFDEYMNEDEAIKCPGAKKAIDGYFADQTHRIQRDPYYGKYFLVRERAT